MDDLAIAVGVQARHHCPELWPPLPSSHDTPAQRAQFTSQGVRPFLAQHTHTGLDRGPRHSGDWIAAMDRAGQGRGETVLGLLSLGCSQGPILAAVQGGKQLL